MVSTSIVSWELGILREQYNDRVRYRQVLNEKTAGVYVSAQDVELALVALSHFRCSQPSWTEFQQLASRGDFPAVERELAMAFGESIPRLLYDAFVTRHRERYLQNFLMFDLKKELKAVVQHRKQGRWREGFAHLSCIEQRANEYGIDVRTELGGLAAALGN